MPSAACPTNAVFCDDFEDGNLDGWTKLESGGTISIDTAQAVSGRSSLVVTIPANGRGGFVERAGAPLFPLPNKTMFGRVMVYFESLPNGHTDVIRGAGTNGATPWYNVGEQAGDVLLNYYTSAADCWARPRPTRRLPPQTWMCWEWVFDGNANEMQFYIDGQLSRTVTGTGDGCNSGNATWTAPTFSSLRMGQYIAQPSSTPTKIWLDDIAVGTSARLGCPPSAAAAQ